MGRKLRFLSSFYTLVKGTSYIFVLLNANQGVFKVCFGLGRPLHRASLFYYAVVVVVVVVTYEGFCYLQPQVGVLTDGNYPVFFGVIDACTNSEIPRLH